VVEFERNIPNLIKSATRDNLRWKQFAKMTAKAVVIENREPWIHKAFLKEKLVIRERYWRRLRDINIQTSDLITVIPTVGIWRKYLPLCMKVTEKCPKFRLTLLESVVELLDWRHSSNCILSESGERVPEKTAEHEKSRLRKMMEENRIIPFCDMSFRDDEFDEFDLLDYSCMKIQDRCNAAVYRAARMFHSPVVVIVEGDDVENPSDYEVDTKLIDGFLDLIFQYMPIEEQNKISSIKEDCESSYERRNNFSVNDTVLVDDYISEQEINVGLQDGSLYCGKLDVTKQNFREAYVTTTNGRFFIDQGLGHFNRAIHHDIVIVKPLPENQWGRPVGRRRIVLNDNTEENDADIDDNTASPVPSAIVVAIKSPSRRRYVATLLDTPSIDDRAIIVVPIDSRIPRIRIQTKSWQKLESQRLLVEIDGWEFGSNYPTGHCVEILGPYGDLETEIRCLLLEHEIQLTPFSNSALAILPPEGDKWRIPKEEIDSRRDLRKQCRIFSVDPIGCQDIDDSMHIRVLNNGDIEVGVHIADVTYFVPHNSALDKEAQRRATTFYLVDRRFDMLPSLLSSNLCSLHGNQDRLAVSVIWIMSHDFERIKSTWFGRTVIHNCQAMTYEQAHNILQNKPPDDLQQPPPPALTAGYRVKQNQIACLKKDLTMLTELTRKLRKRREDIGGAVNLSNEDLGNELKFVLDDKGNPVKVSNKKELEIHHTIAELMILANQSVAEKIFTCFPTSSLLRIHRSVDANKFEDLEIAMKASGIAFDGRCNKFLAESLRKAKESERERTIVNALMQSLATRAMSEAAYVSSGNVGPGVNLTHYGLGIDKYTHFTSPIRRYADVIVHKQLFASLDIENATLNVGPPPGFNARSPKIILPNSKAISILEGEGLQSKPNSIVTKNADVTNANDGITEKLEEVSHSSPLIQKITPYESNEVARICENLNNQNRRAKLSSSECQKLFLSLYFKDHDCTAKAIVTDLRSNGLIVFIPTFDVKGSLYLSDKSGNVILDPFLIGLPEDSGVDMAGSVVAGKRNRRFPGGTITLHEDPENVSKSKVEVNIPGSQKRLVFRILDVITVRVYCDLTDIKARIPLPTINLVAASSPKEARNDSITPVLKKRSDFEIAAKATPQAETLASSFPSMYKVLATIPKNPTVFPTPNRPRTQKTEFCSSMIGRKAFGSFINPDTRSALQDAAASASLMSSIYQNSESSHLIAQGKDFNAARMIERNITARSQKLAAEKRHTRKSKGK
jgi:VacB/RNase II family 3'-5' exoribonuclease